MHKAVLFMFVKLVTVRVFARRAHRPIYRHIVLGGKSGWHATTHPSEFQTSEVTEVRVTLAGSGVTYATGRRLLLKSRCHLDTHAEHARLAARPRQRRGGRAGRRGLAAHGRARLSLRLCLRGVVEHHARARSLALVGGAAAVPGEG